jgi:TPP-dependent indolepyruvate ferredoxin oxidoreductase alpha subunit/Pyruvate/2-oxoacid:ferredoxin oxidoreductase gamma subunit
MATDPRYLVDSGREIFTGNELLIKGALETEGGVHLLTGYPGSPVAGFFDIMGDISDLLKSKGIRAFQANNEALGVAAVNGSQMVAARAIVAFKSVGTHVASDALALGNMAGSHPEGGVVVISGEDPWCDSTQVPADSRFLFEHLRMPVVEPGTAQQLKDWINLSFELSRAAGLYIGYIVTVAHADGGGTVECHPNQWPTLNTNRRVELETKDIPVQKTVLLPPRTWQKELQTDDRFAATIAKASELGINKFVSSTGVSPVPGDSGHGGDARVTAPLGFIVTGMAGPYLNHVLSDIGLLGQFPVLQMGMSYPVDIELVAEFSKQCKHMVVIEERRSFLEKNIRDAAFKYLSHEDAVDVTGRLYGKVFPSSDRKTDEKENANVERSTSNVERPGGRSTVDSSLRGSTLDVGRSAFNSSIAKRPGIPDTRGLNPSVLAQVLIPLIKATEEIPAELRNGRLTAELSRLRELSKPKLAVFNEKVVARTPTFCPGCPHRDSSSALMELRNNLADPAYMKAHHNRPPVDLVAHGDTGCYTMLMFAPTEQLMHNYSGMGLGGGTGSGIDPFITNKQIVFMGDGTFFHSGQVAISNSVKAGQDITYIILENKTTAMTGHQEHAGTELDAMGNRSYIQDIEEIVRSMAGTSPMTVQKLSPADKQAYRNVLEQTILADGVKVVIADKECGITYHRKELKAERKTIKEKGYLPEKTHMNVTPEVCENCLECTKATACPGLTTVDTDYGRKIDTDLTWCVNDGACVRVTVSNEAGTGVKPCPSFEQVKVVRKKRRRYNLPHMALDKLPEPTPLHKMDTPGDAWRVHMAGVGGMGIGVVGAILIRAGHKEGYRVLFQDKKGLAIRNGGVYGQMTFVRDAASDVTASTEPSGSTAGSSIGTTENTNIDHRTSNAERRMEENSSDSSSASFIRSSKFEVQRSTFGSTYATTGAIPYGKADLLLGVDILEAARALDPREQFRVAHKDRTAAVLNEYKQPTVLTLLGRHDFDPAALRQEIYDNCRADLSFSRNLSEICEQRLGSKQFVNIMMLGVAFQLGLIPVTAHSIAWAIKDSIRRDHRKNLKAFNIGRKLALEPRALPRKPEPDTWEHLVTNKSKILRKTRYNGRTHADQFEKLTQGATKAMRDLPEETKYDLTLRIYDLLQYEDAVFAKRYVDLVRSVYRRDSAEHGYAATEAAIWNLAKVMLIKDEPYVAYLLTRYEKKQRDIAKYAVDVANGDKLVYRHHTSPEFNIGKRRIRFQITTTDWQLNIVRHMKWWRKLPGWHSREVGFRDWYIGLLDRVGMSDESYAAAVNILKCPEEVTGYREVRYPKMDKVKQRVETDLTNTPKIEVQINREAITGMRTPAAV